MGNISKSVIGVFKKAGKAFTNYPAVIFNAILFCFITFVRINLDWPVQEANNFLLNCLQLSFGLGALFSLAAITYAQSRINTKQAFLGANLAGLAVMGITFLLLFFFGGILPEQTFAGAGVYKELHPLSVPRVVAAGFISSLAFIVFAGYPQGKSDFSKALFMTIKAFFIALVYGLVILAGTAGVAGAIQALLYPELSSKVYQYIATISGFAGFTIFVGYFPDFRKGNEDPQREVAQSQSRFIVVLLDFILVPIMLALTLVLILWAGRTILNGMDTKFIQLYGIATAYAIGGILLHILVTHSESGAAKLYKQKFPIAVLFILMFEAWALYLQLNRFGLKPTEYLFIVVWIIAFVSAILLILQKSKAHHLIAYLTAVAVIIAVLPVIGYGDLPVVSQVDRLQKLLISQNMLKDNKIVRSETQPDQTTREAITDSVDFLINLPNVSYPQWLDKGALSTSFNSVLGFARTYPETDPNQIPEQVGNYFNLIPQVIDITGYQWELGSSFQGIDFDLKQFTGNNGVYTIEWGGVDKFSRTILTIQRDGKTILESDLKAFFADLVVKHPTSGTVINLPVEDMMLKLESPEADVLIIFNNIEVRQDNEPYYGYSIRIMLMNEK